MKRVNIFMVVMILFCCMEGISQASYIPERKTFSVEQFKQFGFVSDAVNLQGMLTILQLLYEVNEPMFDKTDLQEQVFFTDAARLDVNHDGQADIVALVNHKVTTANPIEVLVIYSLNDGWAAQTLRTDRGVFEESVLDVNHDGLYEICVNEPIHGETLRFLEQYWVHVYAWNGEAYIESDTQFVESFYRPRYLPRLATRMEMASEMLRNGERRTMISAMLQDCRTALERVVALSTTAADTSNRSRGFAHELESISTQIGTIQTELRQEDHQDDIHAALEQTHQMLQQLSSAPATERQ